MNDSIPNSRYLLAGEAFRTKTEVVQRIQAILHHTPLGASVHMKDEAVLLDLLASHPHVREKIGAGIARILVHSPALYPHSRGFVIERTDGSRIDFSYRKCLQPASLWQHVAAAFRRAVDPQIRERKTRVFAGRETMRCPVTDKWCGWDEVHVDHRPPLTFAQLSRDFLECERLTVEAIHLVPGPGGLGNVVGDRYIDLAWREFHRLFADLWVISIDAHVALTRQRMLAAMAPEVDDDGLRDVAPLSHRGQPQLPLL
jgi:Protein of unknown function (DUF3223)